MNKRFLMVCLAILATLAGGAQAAPITFFDDQYDVTAVAIGDGAPGAEAQSGPVAATPLSASASSGTLDLATAGAIAAPGLLNTSADATGGGGIASGAASAHFVGSFLNDGRITLNLDFLSLDAAVDSGHSSTSLFVWLTSGGATLFQDFVTEAWQFAYAPVLGTTSVLDLTLSSQASAGFQTLGAGGASAFGMVNFDGVVPEPSSLWLVGASLGLLAAGRSRFRFHPPA